MTFDFIGHQSDKEFFKCYSPWEDAEKFKGDPSKPVWMDVGKGK